MDRMATVVGGVDTHLDVHVAAALDERGGLLGTESFPASPIGYRRLLGWLRSFGQLNTVGVEGTGSYGAGLTRHLQTVGIEVLEVDRPNRQERRKTGKSDTLDAVAAARAVLAGTANGAAKSRDGNVECIRVLRVARISANKARTQAINQLHSLVCTAPPELREQLRGRSRDELIAGCAALRPGGGRDVTTITKRTLRLLARRAIALQAEMDDLAELIKPLVVKHAPELVGRYGVGPDTASALLVAAGDNPGRLRNEASFARLCGVAPIPATSGKITTRHRLHRGGDRQANAALWRVVMTRMSSDPDTRRYVERRLKEGLSKREIMRCLKRYTARELYAYLPCETAT
jgi:transposase